MHIQDGTLILTDHECWNCDETGKVEERVRVDCPKCNGTGKGPRGGRGGCKQCMGLRYDWILSGRMVDCHRCEGTGREPDDIYDSVPEDLWKSLNFAVIRSERGQSWQEQYLGIGCYSVTDYGEHKNLTDDELIAKVRDRNSGGYPQACKLIRGKDNLTIASRVVIITARSGYSVIGEA